MGCNVSTLSKKRIFNWGNKFWTYDILKGLCNLAWTLKKNCVLPPRQFGMCLGFAGAISLGIGLAWASMGFWLVFLFVLAECAVLLIAFFCYSLHAADFEKVVLTEKEILFEFETALVKEKLRGYLDFRQRQR